MRFFLILCSLISFALLSPDVAARGAPPSQREQKEALESFRKFYSSALASVRAMGVSKLRDMDFKWRVEELVKVIAKESSSKNEEDFVVVQEAIEVLGTTRDTAAVKALMEAVIEQRSPDIRMSLMESLGGLSFEEDAAELPWDEVDKVLDAGLASSTAEDVMAAADCYGALRRSDKFDLIAAHISHPDWRVRGAVAGAIVKMFDKNTNPRGLDELIAQLESEQGKLRTQIRDGLEGITGWGCGFDVDCWKAKHMRWKSGQEHFGGKGGGEGPQEEDTAVFWNIPLTSDRLLFVVDVSSSMLERYHDLDETTVQTDQDWKDNPNDLAGPGELSKWDVAREEITNAISNLKEHQTFNIIFFSDGQNKWQSGLVPANERNRAKAIKKVESIKISRKAMTNMYGALEGAFKMAGGGVTRQGGSVGIDTVFFFTDGYPTAGEIHLQTPLIGADGKPVEDPKTGKKKTIPTNECYRRIANTVKRVNRFDKVTIHCIGVGDHAETLLYSLARNSGGEYRKVEQVMAERAKKRKQMEGLGEDDN